jgi:hypothetical protein
MKQIAEIIEGRYPTDEENAAAKKRAAILFGPPTPRQRPPAKQTQTGRIVRAVVTGWIEETIEGDDEYVTARLQAIYNLKNAAIDAILGEGAVKKAYQNQKYAIEKWGLNKYHFYLKVPDSIKKIIEDHEIKVFVKTVADGMFNKII